MFQGVEAPKGPFASSSLTSDLSIQSALLVPASSLIQARPVPSKNDPSVRFSGSLAATAECLSVGTEYCKKRLQFYRLQFNGVIVVVDQHAP